MWYSPRLLSFELFSASLTSSVRYLAASISRFRLQVCTSVSVAIPAIVVTIAMGRLRWQDRCRQGHRYVSNVFNFSFSHVCAFVLVPLTQESAVLQVLLEFVHPRFEAGAECRSIVLSYVQERLVGEPRLLRILHMQRYDAELIPFIVEQVPAGKTTSNGTRQWAEARWWSGRQR